MGGTLVAGVFLTTNYFWVFNYKFYKLDEFYKLIFGVGQWYAAGDCRVGHWLHTSYIFHFTSYIEGGWDTG